MAAVVTVPSTSVLRLALSWFSFLLDYMASKLGELIWIKNSVFLLTFLELISVPWQSSTCAFTKSIGIGGAIQYWMGDTASFCRKEYF